jgi:flagellar hook-basal body complex protein FliE
LKETSPFVEMHKMKDEKKAKKQLINDFTEISQRIAKSEALKVKFNLTEDEVLRDV